MTYRFHVLLTKEEEFYVARCPELVLLLKATMSKVLAEICAKPSNCIWKPGRKFKRHPLSDRSKTNALTVSKASAAFVKRLMEK